MNKSFSCISALLLAATCIFNVSCKKYLDLKPDKTQLVPSTLQDCQAILDNYTYMNSAQLNYAEGLSDNIYLLETGFNALSVTNRDLFIWNADANPNYLDYGTTYQRILYANQVLETLGKIDPSPPDMVTWSELKGAALFFRSYSLFNAAQLWCNNYNPSTSGSDLGLPIKLTSDLNEKTIRGTVMGTYSRILQDLKEAVGLLPVNVPISSRPCKAAAFAALGRVYLSMGDYVNAKKYADSCLQIRSILLDFSALNSKQAYPFTQFNIEVLFSAKATGGMFSAILPSNARIDSELYNSYEIGDLRKDVFFINNPDGSHSFKGSYDGSNAANPFTGLATDEIYLIRAECLARSGALKEALICLNELLKTRWSHLVNYQNIESDNAAQVLNIILAERRKELLYRNIRWSDLRRLNREPGNEKVLKRTIGGRIYTLPANDLRYVLKIPTEVLNRVTITQNPR